jgi:hypothetical protein
MPPALLVVIYILFFCLINRYLIKNIKNKGEEVAVQHNMDTKYPVLHNMLFTTNKPKKITSIKKIVLDLYHYYRILS